MNETLKEVSKCYRTVEAEKIISKIAQEEINTWSDHIEEQMEKADKKIGLLEQWLSASGNIKAKLPKLTITKFNGTYADWPRFWRQYSETVDKAGTPPVTKFSYLRELSCEKAKKAIKALPYTAEGYNRAIAILKDRFGKDSEIVKAYVKEILDLPYTPSSNPK